VESSGFVTRSAKELLVATVGGVFSLGEDIVQFASQISDQMVIREWNVQLRRSSREDCGCRLETQVRKVKLCSKGRWVLGVTRKLGAILNAG
jgi:hypothetical protein